MSHIELEFRYSSSPRYAAALAALRAIPGATTDGYGKGSVHRVPVEAVGDPQLAELLFCIAGWRSVRVRVDGALGPAGAPAWLRRVSACAAAREVALFGAQYCWGPPFAFQRVPCRLIEEALPWMVDISGWRLDWEPVVAAVADERLIAHCPWFDRASVAGELQRRAERARWRESDDPIERLFGSTGIPMEAPWWALPRDGEDPRRGEQH